MRVIFQDWFWFVHIPFVLYSGWSNVGQHFFIRIYTSFYSFGRSWSFCGLLDRRTVGDKTDCHIDLQLLLLTIVRSVIFKTHLALLLLLGQGCWTRGLVWATGTSGHTLSDCKRALTRPSLTPTLSTEGHPTGGCILQWGALTDCKLARIPAFTASNWLNCRGHLHILFHNAHLLPIRSFDLLPLIYTGASLIDSSVKDQYVTLGTIIIITSSEFFLLALGSGLLLEFKWQQVSRNLFSILANLNKSILTML